MKVTVYRQVTRARRTSRPRRIQSEPGFFGSFGQMLAKLSGASEELERARRRSRR